MHSNRPALNPFKSNKIPALKPCPAAPKTWRSPELYECPCLLQRHELDCGVGDVQQLPRQRASPKRLCPRKARVVTVKQHPSHP